MFSGVFTQRHCLIEQFSGLLMATRTGLEPVASTVTGWRDTLLHQRAICNYWCAKWDLNPHGCPAVFETAASADSAIRANSQVNGTRLNRL